MRREDRENHAIGNFNNLAVLSSDRPDPSPDEALVSLPFLVKLPGDRRQVEAARHHLVRPIFNQLLKQLQAAGFLTVRENLVAVVAGRVEPMDYGLRQKRKDHL